MENRKNQLLIKLSHWLETQSVRLKQWVQPREFSRLSTFAMGDRNRMVQHYTIALDLKRRGISGDFVECGVYNGGSAATFALGLKDVVEKFWLYDSFAGMPVPTEMDRQEAFRYVGVCRGSVEKVRQAMAISGVPEAQYTIRTGLFKDTFQLELPKKIALLHIDADWHESVLLCLETFYALVVEGGIILLDDFGHWEGCREALFDFLEHHHLRPVLERFSHTQLFWIKGRTHNREFVGRKNVLSEI